MISVVFSRDIELDFKSTINILKSIKATINTIGSLRFETIPGVEGDIEILFTHMGFKLPNRI